jgi:Ca-activated chloride channel family protein
MRWAEPAWLALAVLIVLPWLWERARPRLAWPSLVPFAGAGPGWAARSSWLPTLLLSMAIAAMAVALARPQTVGGRTRIAARGVAVVVAIDRSSSMKAADFPDGDKKLTRLDAAKRTLTRFIDARPDDLVGVVAFANYPDLTCPPTLDHEFARSAVNALSPAVGSDDGTNLGDALAVSLDALRKAPASSRVLILLSDGRNDPNVPNPLDPMAAARLCRGLGVTLHTIAVGGAGGIVRETDPASGLPIPAEVGGPDFAMLESLARLGGGNAFRATDAKSLDAVFAAIDELEKSPVTGTILTRYNERFAPWAVAALICLSLARSFRNGRLSRLP